MAEGLEIVGNQLTMAPGPIDPHGHPRIFDRIVPDGFLPINGGEDGKAGLTVYTSAALASGFTAMVAMGNEQLRRFTGQEPEQTELVPFPVFQLDRIHATQAAIGQESLIPMGINMVVDPVDIYMDADHTRLNEDRLQERFAASKDQVLGLKIFGDISTGGFNVRPEHIPRMLELWHAHQEGRPATLHLEGENVGKVLREVMALEGGRDIAINIAHVSSRLELEAVIEAKKAGMNVMCEVTPHHLFLDESEVQTLGGYACMKPTLKTREDIDFLWANIDFIDWFGSDCAPHRTSDKQDEPATFGVTNHTVMIPLLLGAVQQGKLTYEQFYEKLCINARQRYGLPMDDGSEVIVSELNNTDIPAGTYNAFIGPRYANTNPFTRRPNDLLLAGYVSMALAGRSKYAYNHDVGEYEQFSTSLSHLLRPSTLAASVRYWTGQQSQ